MLTTDSPNALTPTPKTESGRFPIRRGQRRGLALKLIVIAVAVVGVTGVGVATMTWGGGEVAAKADQFVVTKRSFDITAGGNGELRAKKQTTIRSSLEEQTAIVEIIPEGSRVSKGDVIVRLNADDIQKRLDDDMLLLESARSEMVSADNAYQIQLSDNESMLRQAKLKIEIAELELMKWQEGEVTEKQLGLDLDLERAEREFVRLEAKFKRAKLLFDRDFLSKDELDKDEVSFIEAESKLKTSKLAIEVFQEFTLVKDHKQKTSDVDEAKAELDRTIRKNESELASKEAQLTNRRRQLQLREERVAKLREQIASCTVKAPTDGLVVYATSLNQNMWGGDGNAYDVGSEIRPNQEIIALPDTTEMVALVKIPEALLSRVRPGQKASVVIDAAQGKSYSGVIDTIGVMAQTAGWRDPNVREYEVRINLVMGTEAHKLKPSMRCEARIVLGTVTDALAVPIQSVFMDGRRQFVYTLAGDMYAQTDVQMGRRSDSFVEIVSGLSGGEIVLLREPSPGRVLKRPASEKKAEGPTMAGGPGNSGRPGAGGSSRGAPAGETPGNDASPQNGRGAAEAAKPEKTGETVSRAEDDDEAEDALADGDEAKDDESDADS